MKLFYDFLSIHIYIPNVWIYILGKRKDCDFILLCDFKFNFTLYNLFFYQFIWKKLNLPVIMFFFFLFLICNSCLFHRPLKIKKDVNFWKLTTVTFTIWKSGFWGNLTGILLSLNCHKYTNNIKERLNNIHIDFFRIHIIKWQIFCHKIF